MHDVGCTILELEVVLAFVYDTITINQRHDRVSAGDRTH